MDEDQNVFQFGAIKGGKPAEDTSSIPSDDYTIIDLDDDAFDATGFLIFTPHHLAIMRDTGRGAVPVFCIPIGRVKAAALTADLEGDSD